MAQIIIYYNDNKFIITDNKSIEENYPPDFYQPEDIKKFLPDKISFRNNTFCFKTDKPSEAMNILRKKYENIEASGGLVMNGYKEFLFIFRRKIWDLPKGKCDTDEAPETTAYREISEECGITGHKIVSKICETFHIYTEDSKHILKKTHWFAFVIESRPHLIPQLSEQIEEAKWMTPKESEEIMIFTFPSVRQVWEDAKKIRKFLI